MKKRTFNIAYIRAEVKAMKVIGKFNKEMENAQPSVQASQQGQNNPATGNVSQQPVNGI